VRADDREGGWIDRQGLNSDGLSQGTSITVF